jgi:RNA polymerase sigma-70 factor (ECF subfamily)
MAESPPAARFPTMHRSRVVSAGDPPAPEAREVLAELYTAYWYPVYAFIRRHGQRCEDAADLPQDDFAWLIETGVLAVADRSKSTESAPADRSFRESSSAE